MVHGAHRATLSSAGRKVIPGHPASAEGLHSKQEEAEAGSGTGVQPLSSEQEMLHAGGNAVVEGSSVAAASACYAHQLIVLRVLQASCTVR